MICRPSFLYFAFQAVRCVIARWQLMQEYAQKSTRTTLPFSPAMLSALSFGVFSHCWIPAIAGAGPQFCRVALGALAQAVSAPLEVALSPDPSVVPTFPAPTLLLRAAV